MLALAVKAFKLEGRPLKLPFKLLHVDTGHNYPEVIQFRDETVARTGVQLVVAALKIPSKKARSSCAAKPIRATPRRRLRSWKPLKNKALTR